MVERIKKLQQLFKAFENTYCLVIIIIVISRWILLIVSV